MAVPAGFSLTALEELLAENKRLAAAEKLQLEPPPQQLADLAAAQVQHLQGMLRGLQQENGALRQQLGQSESLRRKGQKALQELKQVRCLWLASELVALFHGCLS